jgi:hypothetical protein
MSMTKPSLPVIGVYSALALTFVCISVLLGVTIYIHKTPCAWPNPTLGTAVKAPPCYLCGNDGSKGVLDVPSGVCIPPQGAPCAYGGGKSKYLANSPMCLPTGFQNKF